MTVIDATTVTERFGNDVLENVEYRDCILHCSIGWGNIKPQDRAKVRHIRAINCSNYNVSIMGALIEDVHIENLKRHGSAPLFCWGCAFRHVTLTGPMSGIKLNPEFEVDTSRPKSVEANEQWNHANAEFYRTVDWAIDITQAQFKGSISLEAIPGRLVRRDPETQVLVERNVLNASDWKSWDYGRTSVPIAIDWFLDRSPYDDCVLVAPRKAKNFRDELTVLQILRDRGVAT